MRGSFILLPLGMLRINKKVDIIFMNFLKTANCQSQYLANKLLFCTCINYL